VGTLADATTFSFYATKTITTGEGGMVTTEREDLANRVRLMSLHGLSGDAWRRYADKGSWYYEVLEFGFKYNMTDIAASLGLRQLPRAEEFAKRRREIAGVYSEAFVRLEGCRVPVVTDTRDHAWHLYILLVNGAGGASRRDKLIADLARRGIGTSVHFIPLHRHPAYRRTFGESGRAYPNADWLFTRAVSLPIYPRMTDDDVTRVIEAVTQSLRSRAK
jgi:dTDP-4-amino-4,6-dideoxygalactose transaminase